jgi:hypothetical protein
MPGPRFVSEIFPECRAGRLTTRQDVFSETPVPWIQDVFSKTPVPSIQDVFSKTPVPWIQDVFSKTPFPSIQDVFSKTPVPSIRIRLHKYETGVQTIVSCKYLLAGFSLSGPEVCQPLELCGIHVVKIVLIPVCAVCKHRVTDRIRQSIAC